ncbi:microsomal signal peptidase 12 kDa subunit-domain-containing protein [Emericellopsis atlantica]|uniref:Signal peptidase complex subunit 1 n=1 Tax=Emericellopsis atlantica TaxID=2614577 RepID=A0A9P7ZIT1_9HYPO|nr:microsomal signal peptidase 12 kDa subunit-domain-containing protein [Emericellopsis atlantica]KAG9252775.1 microsomal signal peptidase 12 kDa subunit-domain-containing protein [Emericellopsis atlantica]
MAEEILDKVRDVVEGEIDFKGQKRAELIGTLLLAITGLIAFNVGWVKQDIVLAMYLGGAGTALSFIAVVPPWPFYNKDPAKWLPVGSGLTVG